MVLPSSNGFGNDEVEWFLCPLAPLLDEEVARGNYDHPLAAPYSDVVQFGDGHGNMMSPSLFFFFLAVMALGVPPLRSYYSMAAWCVSWPRVTLGSAEGFSVPVKPFNFPMFFEALPF